MTTKLKEINKTINQLDKKFNFRNLRPIHDSLVLKKISTFVQSKNWFEKTALKENAGISFVRKYKSWISSSKLNHLINIQKYKYRYDVWSSKRRWAENATYLHRIHKVVWSNIIRFSSNNAASVNSPP